MELNPFRYFLKRYHSPDLRPSEMKRMLNLWLPFVINQIRIKSISNDFQQVNVILKHSFWNRNPYKAVWGGAIASTVDPFFPMMLKQVFLRKGIPTDFLSKASNVQFLKLVESDLTFPFRVSSENITSAEKALQETGKYAGWHTVEAVDKNGKICVKGEVQVYLRLRNN